MRGAAGHHGLFLNAQASAAGIFAKRRSANRRRSTSCDDRRCRLGDRPAHLRDAIHAGTRPIRRGRCWPTATSRGRRQNIVITLRQGVHLPQRPGNDRGGRRRLAAGAGASWRARQAADGDGDVGEATGKYEVTLELSAAERRLEEPARRSSRVGLAIYPAEIAAERAISRSSRRTISAPAPTSSRNGGRTAMSNSTSSMATSRPRKQATASPARASPIFDTIRFIPVPDVGTRVSGVQAGDYDYAEMISGDLYDTLSKDPTVSIPAQRTRRSSGCSSRTRRRASSRTTSSSAATIQTALDKSQGLASSPYSAPQGPCGACPCPSGIPCFEFMKNRPKIGAFVRCT